MQTEDDGHFLNPHSDLLSCIWGTILILVASVRAGAAAVVAEGVKSRNWSLLRLWRAPCVSDVVNLDLSFRTRIVSPHDSSGLEFSGAVFDF